MPKKLFYLVPIVALIMVIGTNSGRCDVLKWSGNASPDPNWHIPQNWDKGVVPVGGDDAYCTKNTGKPDPNFTSLSSSDPLCLLCIADVSADGELNIDGGTLNVVSAIRASKGSSGARTATVNMKGGTVALYGSNITVGGCTGSIVNDGPLYWSPNGAGETVDSTWNMTGGLITCGTFSIIPAGTNSHSVFNLDGGTVIVRGRSVGVDGWTPGSGDAGFFVNESVATNRTDPNAHYRRGRNALGILNVAGGKLIATGNITPLFENRYDETTGSDMGLIDACDVIRAYPVSVYPEYPDSSYNKYIVYDYDQRNDSKTTLTASAIEIAKAWKPDPVDGSLYVTITPTLKWNGGAGATDGHDVYFGTNSAHVPPGDPCEYVPGTLALGQQYFWQVVANPPSGEAELWKFTVEGKAKGPSPLNEASIETDASRNVTLSWTAGAYATSHDVCFGTSCWNQIDPCSVVQCTLGQINYWCVNENSDAAHGPVTTMGNIWSFTVADYDLLDNFESYTSSNFSSTWKTSNNMPLFLAVNSGRTSKDPVKSGKQGMLVQYSYTGANSSASNALFTAAQDWTSSASGAVALSFWMRGKGNNPALTNLYIQLATGTSTSSAYYSGKVPIYNYSSILSDESEAWTNVNIALNDFNTGKGASFNLNSVRRLFIGSSASGAETGMFWVDDFRLYPSRCVYDREPVGKAGASLADITNDCVVNYSDLYKVTDDWLDSDTNPDANGVLHNCKFDGNSVDGVYDKALKLDEPMDWVDIDDLAFPQFSDKTVAFWVRVDERPTPPTTKLLIFSTSSAWRLNVIAEGDVSDTILEAEVGSQFVEPDPIGITHVSEGSWHHVAMTVGPVSSGEVDCTFYIDGTLKQTSTLEAHYYYELAGACIGGLNNGKSQHSNITIDDFRIYNRALTTSEVLALKNSTPPADTPLIKYDFDETTGTVAANTGSISTVHHPVGYTLGASGPPLFEISPAELYTGTDGGKTYINCKDYAYLAKHWLYGQGGTWVFP